MFLPFLPALCVLCGPGASRARAQDLWPEMSSPAPAIGGGENDAAVVVGVQGYAFVGEVPGAEANAKAWHRHLTETLGVAPENVKLLTGVDGTREEILSAARKAASRAGPKGTLWFVFVGHGAPSADGKDGLLVGVDAQQKAESLESRSLRRQELLQVLGKSRASAIRVVLDACFSGRKPDGSSLAPGLQPLLTVLSPGAADPRMIVLTAAKGDQFAGPLPGAGRPAFSYLVLGGLRGWAGENDGRVTAGSLLRYATRALEATLRGRNQTPDLMGQEDATVSASAGEKGPNLARLAQATAGGGAREEMFKVSNLPVVPRAQAPAAMTDMGLGADFRDLDVDALDRYDQATRFDEGEGSAEEKARTWRDLADSAPKFAEKANARAAQWDRYAQELAETEEAGRKRAEARDKDWGKLGRLLAMKVVPAPDKTRWAAAFVAAYGKTSEDNPYVAELAAYLPAGTVKVTPGAKAVAPRVVRGAAGISWVTIPGGSFMMGSEESANEKPRHSVTVKTFQLAKTEATNKQYRACVEAGACSALDSYSGGDDHPVVGVDWEQSKKFSEWAGGRLPTEAEWEYAARSGGKEQRYPWGNQDATCERAAISGCGMAASVCSKTAGNTKQGLCDMAGNVREWTQDWYHAYDAGAPTDGSAWEIPAAVGRVLRDGAWAADAATSRSAYRLNMMPSFRNIDTGFRPAR